MFRTALVIATLAVGGAAFPAYAQELVGQYHTTFVNSNGLPQPVWLTIQNLSPGEQGAIVSYSKPRQCKLFFEYGGNINGEHFLYRDNFGGNGDWCHEKYNQGVILKIFPQNGRDTKYELIVDKKIIESQVVSRQ
ncbi:hypothetical protein P7L70_02875 (plasmid) [Tistrella mobilis]|uniref:hypothetical protein n=1 Tax=Tistrella mobilis TaxID=171437 RepID=UPI003557C32E